jgi:hypothetical protein
MLKKGTTITWCASSAEKAWIAMKCSSGRWRNIYGINTTSGWISSIRSLMAFVKIAVNSSESLVIIFLIMQCN